MPRVLLAVLIAALVGAIAFVPTAEAARSKHGKVNKRHRAAAAVQGSSSGVLRAPKRRRGLAAYGRLVAIKPASRPAATSAPASVSVVPDLPPVSPPVVPQLPVDPGDPLGSFASVRARDSATNFSFTLSRPLLAAGAIRLQLQNSGEDPHDLTVEPAGGGAISATTGVVAPGGNGSLSATLPSGQYRLYCSLFDHAARGMQATLDVR